MNMVDLVLTVCLVASGQPDKDCHDEHLYFESRGSLMHCMSLAPVEIARWAEQHPKHQVKRWKCQFPGKEQET